MLIPILTVTLSLLPKEDLKKCTTITKQVYYKKKNNITINEVVS